MKNPKMQVPIFVEDSTDDVIKHWISSCEEGTLGQGLSRNRAGRIEGHGQVTFGEKTTCYDAFDVVKVEGHFNDGLLDGVASVHFKNSTFFVATFRHGSISGIFRNFGCQFGHCDYEEPDSWNIPNWLAEVSYRVTGYFDQK